MATTVAGEQMATTNWHLAEPLDRAMLDGIPASSAGRWVEVPASAQAAVHREGLESLAARLVADAGFMRLARMDGPRPEHEPETVAALATMGAAQQVGYLAQRELALLFAAWACVHSRQWAFARVALQLAAAEAFDLEPWLAPFDPAATAAGLAPADAADIERGRRLYFDHGDGLRAFLRALYDDTQRWLGGHGIVRAHLWRGMALSTEPGFRRESLRLQPLTSFSTRSKVALGFAGDGPGVLLATEVPAERILATCRQGFGLLMSAVVVVLGGPGDAWSLAWPAGAGRMDRTEGRFRRLAERAAERGALTTWMTAGAAPARS